LKPPTDMKRKTTNTVLYLLFFVTGISGLIYQVVWGRMFGLVFGNTVFASSTVLAAYFAGLALGGYLAGRFVAERTDGLRIYGILQLGIGLFGALMPLLVQAISGIYGWIYRGFEPSFATLTAIRLLLSFLALIAPCVLIGATLPVMSKYLTDIYRTGRGTIAKLYGINTLGAVVGAFTSGFLLIGRLGILLTTFSAAAINLTVAVLAYLIYLRHLRLFGAAVPRIAGRGPAGDSLRSKAGTTDRSETVDSRTADRSDTTTGTAAADSVPPWLLLLTYGAAGFAALALEVAWTRALVWIIGQDSYAFAAMLSVVLAGIGLGSLLFSFFIDTIKNELPLLYGFQFVLGVFVFLSIAAIHGGHDLIRSILSVVNSSRLLRWVFVNLGAYTIIQMTVASTVMFVPALIMGAAFPLFARMFIRITGNVGRGVGTIYSVNTLGGIAGSLAMGFLIVPILGLLSSIALMGCIYLLVSLVLVAAAGGRRVVLRIGQAAVVLVAGFLLLITANFDFTNILGKTLKSVGDYTFENVLYYREHATGTVMVKQSEVYGTEMLIDGTQVASTGDFDLHSHLYPAHLMSLLKEDPKDVLVVAFGAGGTSGSLLLYDEVQRLDVVEICEGVIEPAKRYFSQMNSNVFDDPRLNLIIQDGKNYVRMTDRSYDIIYSGPIHPQSNQGSAALYTREYFEDCRERLKEGGFQCLWLPLHVTSPVYFKIILKTFMEVYPYVTLWQLPHTENSASHPHLIGSLEPIYPDYGVVKRKLERPAIQKDLERLHDTRFSEPYEFFAQLAMDQDELEKMVEGVESLNTDNLPVVEFYKHTVNLVASSKASKAKLLNEIAKHMQHPLPYIVNVPEDEREQLKKDLDRLYEGYRYLLVGHSLIALSDFSGEDVEQFIRQYYRQAYELLPESSYLQRYLTE